MLILFRLFLIAKPSASRAFYDRVSLAQNAAIPQHKFMYQEITFRARYRLRLTRKHLLWKAFRKRRQLHPILVREEEIKRSKVLLFATMRNEILRLPRFLAHYRRLGVGHFLIVSNDSIDGTDAYLSAESDVSLWQTRKSYKAARFGMDWLTWLQRIYAPGKWILTVDADELLIYSEHETRNLECLTDWLDQKGARSFAAMLLDLYPKGSPDDFEYSADQDPTLVLNWFDATGYRQERRGRHQSITVLGGMRARHFFPNAQDKAPTLSKVPLVKWHKSFAYLSSTHVALPPYLNMCLENDDPGMPSGLLLHTKFLPGIGARAKIDKDRGQQYTKWKAHDAYYDALVQAPDVWNEKSIRYEGWQQMLNLNLMRRGDW